MYDAISYCFQWVIEVSHHTFYISHEGDRFLETIFNPYANVYDDRKITQITDSSL